MAATGRQTIEPTENNLHQKSREHEVRKPKMTLAERLKIADVAVTPIRTLDSAPELLI